MRLLRSTRHVLVAVALAATAAAQTTFQEVEPNDTKGEATPALDMQHGDRLSAWNCGVTHHDIFRVRTAPRMPGIWRHRLVPTFGLFGVTPTLLGRTQFGGVIDPASTLIVQEGSSATQPDDFIQWYGFGGAEEMYVDLVTAASCRSSVEMQLESTPVTPPNVPLTVQPGAGFWVSVEPTSQTSDLDFVVLDGDFDVLPGAGIRRFLWTTEPQASALISQGRYYLGVSQGPLIVDDPAHPEDYADSDPVFDFRGAVASAEVGAGVSFDLDVSGVPLSGTFTDPFEVVWFELDVVSGQNVSSFCPGDGTAGACPCGPSAAGQGAGCANSTGRGGHLMAHGALGTTDLLYDFADLPPGSLAIVFAGLTTQAGEPSLGGNLCLGPGAIRVGPVTIDALGRGRIDAGLDFAAAGFVAGTTVYAQGAYRDAVAPAGCEVNLTNGEALTVLP